jgi:hypothetical protein
MVSLKFIWCLRQLCAPPLMTYLVGVVVCATEEKCALYIWCQVFMVTVVQWIVIRQKSMCSLSNISVTVCVSLMRVWWDDCCVCITQNCHPSQPSGQIHMVSVCLSQHKLQRLYQPDSMVVMEHSIKAQRHHATGEKDRLLGPYDSTCCSMWSRLG